MLRLAVLTALLAASTAGTPGQARPAGETRVVAPLADPRVVPGVGRCTSDGACTVTDAAGTRAVAPLLAR